MKNIIVIVQARMGSTRLPGKTLKKIGKDTVAEKLIKRLRLCKNISNFVFAIPDLKIDDPLAENLKKNKVGFCRGSEEDVLDRFYKTALKFKPDVVIRVTADCPLFEPFILDEMVEFYLNHNYDYVSNILVRSYPRGFDCEIFSFDVLKQAWAEAKNKDHREHVTPYIYLNKDKFTIFDKIAPDNIKRPDYRICIDTHDDFNMVSKIFEYFNGRYDMTAQEIVDFLDEHPEIVEMNRHIEQKKLA